VNSNECEEKRDNRPKNSAVLLDLTALQAAYDVARLKVWQQQPAAFFAIAHIEADGTMVQTDAECKAGIDINYQGVWGYHPLVLTLANTGEVLRLVNRSGNRPSHEGAAAQFDECIALCRAAGFAKIVLRGDTDFSQTTQLDRWHEQGDVEFVFGLDLTAGHHVEADRLPASAWKPLKRPPKYQVQTQPRARPARVKQQSSRRASSQTSAWSVKRWPRCRTGRSPAGTLIGW
jgi:hypothetical protein